MSDDWLIMKRGLFFRPDCKGYTGIRDEAGRYSELIAKSYAVHGGCIIMRASEAPEFTPEVYQDLVVKHLIMQRYALVTALKIFLGHDDRFQVSVGGNPIAVDKMLEEARRLVGGMLS
jgi:hypothetical protein